MATHSSTLAWRIPQTEEPGGLVHGVTESETQPSGCMPFLKPQSARSRLGFRLILNSSGIEILNIQDSDPRLGTQEYFKFGVLSSD